MTQDHMECPLSASELSVVSHFPSPTTEEMLYVFRLNYIIFNNQISSYTVAAAAAAVV